MDPYATSHFSHRALRHDLKTLVARDCAATAVLLSRIAEFEERQLFLPDGYPSMFAYCVRELHFCEGTASRRIYAARAALRFPALFVAVAEGRLHLTAVVMLAKYLTSGNVDELVAAATHKSKAEIEQLIADRFPQRDLPERLQAIALAPPRPAMPAPPAGPHSPENVGACALPTPPALAPGRPHSQENVAPAPPPKMTPLAPQRFGFQFTGDQETRELYEHVRALLSHEVPTGEMALVFRAALKLAATALEKRKFAATTRPRRARSTKSVRHIPAAVKRAVWERDEGRCTFVSDGGNRCAARTRLEFDHREAVACGGESTTENIRLLCRAHNQHAAERAFGSEFMERKRSEARGECGAR